MKNIESAEILCVGTELLLGEVVNTNAAFLSTRLAELGISVYRHTVVGDNVERLKAALRDGFERADLIIMTGGLGPTYDDMTKECVAEYFGRKMLLDEESLKRIQGYFAATCRNMTKNNEKQAYMPEGAVVFKNDNGTAPGLAISGDDGKTAILLPGPPREVYPMFEDSVVPFLKERRKNTLVSKNLNIFGLGESATEEILKDMMKNATNPTIAPYAKEGEVRLRVTAMAESEGEAARMCDATIAEIMASEVGAYIYGIDAGSIEEALVSSLREKGMTIATAESCTGGLIGERITAISGASAVYLGGFVTYTNEAKMKLIGVRAETLDAHTAVSAETAIEMARGARERLSADIGISSTGYAGPTGGTDADPVGTVYVAISSEKGETVKRLSLSRMRDRGYIRYVAASNALFLALKD